MCMLKLCLIQVEFRGLSADHTQLQHHAFHSFCFPSHSYRLTVRKIGYQCHTIPSVFKFLHGVNFSDDEKCMCYLPLGKVHSICHRRCLLNHLQHLPLHGTSEHQSCLLWISLPVIEHSWQLIRKSQSKIFTFMWYVDVNIFNILYIYIDRSLISIE